jgi:shikimate kinase
MPASGKTTVGRKLAASLNREFVDIDEAIETEGMKIAQIFETHGEPYFRELERDTIMRVAKHENQVIALGGGAFEDETTRKLLLKNAFVIYLKVPLSVLRERIAQASHRPLTDVDELYTERAQNYEKAHLIWEFQGENDDIEKLINEIGRKNDKA